MVPPFNSMEWGAGRILALRKHGQMTQAQLAQWLGVSIKQVKYLEHERRNPSGPTKRLLGMLAQQLSFENPQAVQILGASLLPANPAALPSKPKVPRPVNNSKPEPKPSVLEPPKFVVPDPPAASNDQAFVWL